MARRTRTTERMPTLLISHRRWQEPTERRDAGHAMVVLLLVVVALGILSAVASLLVTSIGTEAADSSCVADRRQLQLAYEAFTAQTGNELVPASGTDADRYERGLVEAAYIRTVSELHSLAADGTVIPEDPRC